VALSRWRPRRSAGRGPDFSFHGPDGRGVQALGWGRRAARWSRSRRGRRSAGRRGGRPIQAAEAPV
jgi:hypothetical protein